MTQPNIIFFMVDQLAAKWLEAAMDGICDLLNIQRLKSQGANFTNGYRPKSFHGPSFTYIVKNGTMYKCATSTG